MQAYDTERFSAQATGVQLGFEHPLGVGPGQFEHDQPVSAHSIYVRVLAEQGVLGLATLVALLAGTLALAVRNALDRPRRLRRRRGGAAGRVVRAAGQQRVRRHAPLASSVAGRRADLGGGDQPARLTRCARSRAAIVGQPDP